MQANCPQCSQRIVIDDAKVPDRPFSVKCPKCQTPVRLPGKGAAAPAPPSEAAAVPSDEMLAQLRREIPAAEPGSAGRALVAVPDRNQAGALTLCLTRLGYGVDSIDDPEQAGRVIEQGIYSLVVTNRGTGAPGRESLFQRLGRLSPESRRRMFVVLVGDEFKTADGTQAFAMMADMVVNSRDAGNIDVALRNTVAERTRVYQVFLDAKHRLEAASA